MTDEAPQPDMLARGYQAAHEGTSDPPQPKAGVME
jgi:hypothetical protein